ncbi:LRR receptor-like serine/threonine-protein kinase EFR [Bidens hawaiensis]|uniref:LRR receptor-like serine/threonine-protein kinase EFR n=1 Tax=Bidens hawaiensis TaxID=980011 RepID=UPI0040492551
MNSKQPIVCLLSSPPTHFLLFVLTISLTFTIITTSYGGGNETDYHALLKIKSMVTQDPHGVLTSWNGSLHFCEWTGVTCGKRHRRVTSVVLESQGLQGSLSPHAGNLSFLHRLSLANNSFQGVIPYELGRLSRLRFLYLYQNGFSGVIPANISRCFNLEALGLSYNELVGTIPKEISFLSKLAFLTLHYNKLTGGIPPSLGNITSIEVFAIKENRLRGSIPDTLGHWKSLREIYGSHCNLSATIPRFFYNLSHLTTINLADNQLSGSLPPTIMLPSLVILQLWGNQLTGPLPPSISNCSRLIDFEMARNKLSGKLTIDFAKLKDIGFISIGFNNFGSNESDEMKFIDSLKNQTLEMLDISYCKFQGVLPRSIGNLSSQLPYLYIEGNHLHGSIPISISNLVGLKRLSLRRNQFTGNIPSTIGNLLNLESVFLNSNQLSGLIPDVMGNLSSLITLDLSSNTLEGVIPSSMGNCHNLIELYLNDNKLDGQIPAQLLQLASLSIQLDLSQNNLSGSLPANIGDLKMLTALDLSDNNISGNIPSSLGDCGSMVSLSLKGNLFQGTIPPSFSSLKGLMELDISRNNLSGKIPSFLERLKLEYLNLSYNNFEGEVPTVGVFANESAYSVLGNSRICGGIFELGLPKCEETKTHKKKVPLFVLIILIASTLFIVTCVASVWCKKKRKNHSSQSSTSEQFIKVSYNQLLKATNGFSQSNLIGNGGFSSVYKGILYEYGNRVVAVKVLHLQNQGAQRSFIRECEAWRNIRHRNLLKIITSCSGVDFQGNDFKALVYEHMSNGSLHDWLHSSESTTISRLNLLQIINILTDVAYALDYLHNHCIPAVVHGDLKPSNILLNDDMVAHVGDFGLAQLIGSSYPNSTTNFRGTIGYAPPEYGLSQEMTSSGDVYSFGILLLETMTGKKPTDAMFTEGLNLHKFSSMAFLDHVTDVIDVNILKDYKRWHGFNDEANTKKIEECVAATIKIGVLCSVDSPPQRMNIEKVVHELRHVLDTLQNIEV